MGLNLPRAARDGLLAALVVAVGGAGAGAAGAGGGDDLVPTLSVTKTLVDAKWKEGWLLPGRAVRVTGTVDGPAAIRAILQRLGSPKTQPVRVDAALKHAGTFTLTLPLYVRSLPGKYSLRIVGLGESAGLEPVDATVTLPSPVEGVVDRAEVGTAQTGPWHVYDVDHKSTPVIRGNYKKLWTRFTFLSPPTGGKIEVVWRKQWRVFFGHVAKRYANVIYTWAAYTPPTALDKGTWVVMLKVNGRIAKRGSVRVL